MFSPMTKLFSVAFGVSLAMFATAQISATPVTSVALAPTSSVQAAVPINPFPPAASKIVPINPFPPATVAEVPINPFPPAASAV